MLRDAPHRMSVLLLPKTLTLLEWNQVHEPGCYLHVSSGLLMRVFPEELGSEHLPLTPGQSTRVVMLSRNPVAPLVQLRATADLHGYPFPW